MTGRPLIEVQRAHDILLAFMAEDVGKDLTDQNKAVLSAMCSVLCWVLRHDHNEKFPQILVELEAEARRKGYVLNFFGN